MKQTPQQELDQMNKLILRLLPIEGFQEKVLLSIEEEVGNNPEIFIKDVEEISVEITESDIDRHIETVWEAKYEGFDVPTVVYETIQQNLFNSPRLNDMETGTREVLQDEAEYRRDPLGYVGMSTKDFL